MKNRRIGTTIALATASVGMATVTATAPAEAASSGPQPVSTMLRAVRAHTDTWVNVVWTTDRRICDAEVRITSRDVDITYQGHGDSTTSSPEKARSTRRPAKQSAGRVFSGMTLTYIRAGLVLLCRNDARPNLGERGS